MNFGVEVLGLGAFVDLGRDIAIHMGAPHFCQIQYSGRFVRVYLGPLGLTMLL